MKVRDLIKELIELDQDVDIKINLMKWNKLYEYPEIKNENKVHPVFD
jgi:hypothetical protein